MPGTITQPNWPTLRWAMMIAISGMVWGSAVYGQAGGGSSTRPVPCTVQSLRLRIATGGDDLRGGSDNLDVSLHFGLHESESVTNVNGGSVWANNSMHEVDIKLKRTVPLNQIRSITLKHAGPSLSFSVPQALTPAGPAAGVKTADNWDMRSLEVTAVGNGIGTEIVRHGPHRFTGSEPILNVSATLAANSCDVGERLGRLNPGNSDLRLTKADGTNSRNQTLPSFPVQPAPSNGNQTWQNNRVVQQALAHTIQIGPRASAPPREGEYSALIGLLRKQSMAAHALLVPAVRSPNSNRTLMGGAGDANQNGTLLNGGANMALNRQSLPPKGSAPMLGPSHTMSSSGTQNARTSLTPTATQVNPPREPAAQRPPTGREPAPQPLGRAPLPTQMCRDGIATVDGAANGVWFSPVAGQDGQFVIQGCGFGNMPGEVYLSGLQFPKGRFRSHGGGAINPGAPMFPDRVVFQIPANGWSDRQIVVQIDAHAGGLYDTNNVTLNVKTANGQVYQANGMNFLAAREDQRLKGLLLPPGCTPKSTGAVCVPIGVHLAKVNSAAGVVTPQAESPSMNLLRPGDTIAVEREIAWFHSPIPAAPGASFPAGTDAYQLSLAPGFQLDPSTGVGLRHASVDGSYCQSVNGVYSNRGQWAVNYTSTSSFEVSWEEEGCWPKTAITNGNSVDVLNYASVSAYELQITVLGPRGVSPLVNGTANGMVIKPMQNVELLHRN